MSTDTLTQPAPDPTLDSLQQFLDGIAKTPIGLDVKVSQDGAAVARVRMAGRCEMRGQFSQCRFKKFSKAL